MSCLPGKGSLYNLQLTCKHDRAKFGFPDLQGLEGTRIHEAELLTDPLSGMKYFFAALPLSYIFHDERIYPRHKLQRPGLVEEFFKGRPQLHISLAWVATSGSDAGKVQMFDGQHKAAAQVLLDTTWLPMRIFVDPDIETLLQANTNAGSKLRQVAFDKSAPLRHLGSALYRDRTERYQVETRKSSRRFQLF